jgi:sporulation protein YqfC
MITQNQNRTEHIADSLELPKDVILGIPFISLCGNMEFSIDNHNGILSYESGQIVIRTKHYPICIRGRQLLIDYYTRDSIKIRGQITDICFML